MPALLLENKVCLQDKSRQSLTPNFERLVGKNGWQNLHPAIRRRFGDHAHKVIYNGNIHIHANPIGKIFAALLLPFGKPLPCIKDAYLQAKVDVFPDANGGIVWRRDFLRPNKNPLRVESVKQMGADGHLLECVRKGLLGSIGMALDVFEKEGSLCFKSRNYFLKIGAIQIPISHIFTPGHALIEHIDCAALGEGYFRFRLTMRHKWFGETICQDGVFIDPVGSRELDSRE